MATPNRDVHRAAVGALPGAVNPLALSLNENPFPPLPAVRSALVAVDRLGQPVSGVPARTAAHR